MIFLAALFMLHGASSEPKALLLAKYHWDSVGYCSTIQKTAYVQAADSEPAPPQRLAACTSMYHEETVLIPRWTSVTPI